MDKWYCRDPISSTVAASQIVFNIGNCVDQSRVIQSRPSRPPDSKGRECYVYVLDGSSVRNIRDLPIDDLAPWNSKMCKSSTRFNAVTVNPQRGDMTMRRYIVSDTDNVPECLLACYYCKHPTFKLAKKIFYACDGRREACLPGSYVVFIYEFEGVETLYQRTYQNGSANRQPSGPRRHLTAAATATLGGSPQTPLSVSRSISTNHSASPKRPYGQLAGIQDDVTGTALEAVMNATNNNTILANNNNNSGNAQLNEMLGQIFGNDMKLDDLFQYTQLFSETISNNNNNDNKGLTTLPRMPLTQGTGAGMLNSGNASGAKRRKVSNSVRINYSPVLGTPTQSKEKIETADPTDFRMVYASDAMLDNFRRNGLCDAEKFAGFCESFAEENGTTMASARELGGCLLLEPTFPCGRYFFTILWFRNPTFLLDGQPAVQPVAILVSGRTQPDDYKCLLSDIQSKVQDSGKIIRSILAPESLALEEFSGPGALFAYPCVRLNCLRDFQRNVPDEDLLEVTADMFGADMSDGLLNTLRFEDFVCQLGQLDKKWPAGFRTWFREKSGWIFERLSYGSRLKAGFTGVEHVILENLLADARKNFTRRFETLVESPALEFGLFGAVNALDEITNELFVASAQAIFIDENNGESEQQSTSSSSAGNTPMKSTAVVEEEEEENVSNSTADPSSSSASHSGVNSPVATASMCAASTLSLHPSLRDSCCMTRIQWRKCDSEKRQEILTELGLPTVLSCELCLNAKNGINPDLFKALNRQERIEVLSKAFELDVVRMDLSRFTGSNLEQQQSSTDEEHRFIVFDNAEKSFYYVSGNHGKNMTYCQCQKQKIANFSTAVIKTLICEHLCAVALVNNRFVSTLNASFLAPPQLSNVAVTTSASGEIFDNAADDTVIVGGEPMDSSSVGSAQSKPQMPFEIKLEGSAGVEIIRCAAQSPNSAGSDRDSGVKLASKPIVRSNGGSVHSIINNLHNRSALKNRAAAAVEIPPVFESSPTALENVIAAAQKIMGVNGFPSMKLKDENLY